MSRRSRERENARPWEQPEQDDMPEHDDDTGDLFEGEDDDADNN